jgi:two-component system, NtrC family, C4-dicarboxylate transport response regulator DctD
MIPKVLLVDDDRAVRQALGQTLELADMQPILAGSYIEAKDHISDKFSGVIVSDVSMPGKDGFALLDYAHSVDAELPVILLSGQGDIPMAVRSMGKGAFDFLEKPCAPSDLIAVVQKALRSRALVLENRQLRRQLQSSDAAARMIYGTSAVSEDLRNRIRSVARTTAEVLIWGEPGSSIPKIAEIIHMLSAAAARPFQRIAAASATPDSLAQVFEQAEGGSIFLNEVSGLGPASQFALLELMESDNPARILAGTNQDLAAEAQAGRFLHDLYYRLDAMRLRIPPLRERPEDIGVLFRTYVAQACEQAALPEPEIPEAVIAKLMARDWPGNARSVMNEAMRYAMGLTEDETEPSNGLAEQLARVERSLLEEALRRHGGNATLAAQALRVPRKTFYDKLTRHGLRPELFRSGGV